METRYHFDIWFLQTKPSVGTTHNTAIGKDQTLGEIGCNLPLYWVVFMHFLRYIFDEILRCRWYFDVFLNAHRFHFASKGREEARGCSAPEKFCYWRLWVSLGIWSESKGFQGGVGRYGSHGSKPYWALFFVVFKVQIYQKMPSQVLYFLHWSSVMYPRLWPK